MQLVSNATPTPATRRIRNTDQNPSAVDNAVRLIDKLQQGKWTSSEINYRHVVSSWTGDSYDAVDVMGTRLEEMLAQLAQN